MMNQITTSSPVSGITDTVASSVLSLVMGQSLLLHTNAAQRNGQHWVAVRRAALVGPQLSRGSWGPTCAAFAHCCQDAQRQVGTQLRFLVELAGPAWPTKWKCDHLGVSITCHTASFHNLTAEGCSITGTL